MEYKIKTHLQTLQKSIDGYDDNDDFNIVDKKDIYIIRVLIKNEVVVNIEL